MLDGVSVPRPHGPGLCRLNAVTSKSPIGLLASWLLCASTCSSQEDHCNARAQTVVGILDYDARRQGRERLQHSEMEDLPSLFRCEPNEGRDGEPASIK